MLEKVFVEDNGEVVYVHKPRDPLGPLITLELGIMRADLIRTIVRADMDWDLVQELEGKLQDISGKLLTLQTDISKQFFKEQSKQLEKSEKMDQPEPQIQTLKARFKSLFKRK